MMSEPDRLSLERIQRAVGDSYRLGAQIGAGGMATVYAAEDTRHARRVAIKVLRPDLASTLGADRFLREVAIAARLQHPQILPLVESGASSGLFFYVMPFVEGVSLRARLAHEGELPIDDSLRILAEVLDALAYAHAQKIVHRDIKPENVMLAGYGASGSGRWHAMVADFGVAKAITAAAHESALTATGVAIGTPAYMSPEQAGADPHVDQRADLYAVGVMAYEMLAGVNPFAGPTVQHIIAAHMTQTPERVLTRRPAIPPELDAWVMRALEKRPADRWQTADEMLARLETVARDARARTTPGPAAAPAIERRFRVTADVCRRLDRRTLDPAIIGAEMRLLDNRRSSDVLVYLIHGTGQDHAVFQDLAAELPYRAVAPTLLGFEPARQQRPALALVTHRGLLREVLRTAIDETSASLGAASRRKPLAIVVGFSSGGDVGLQMAADSEREHPRMDALMPLGCNLSLETCFVTRLFRQLGAADESTLMEALRRVGSGSESLEEWLRVHEYFIGAFRKFGHEVAPVRRFSDDIVRGYEERPDAFAELYRAATANIPIVRCVWEESQSVIRHIQELRLRHLDDPSVLGSHYREDSLIIEPGTNHFDLLKPSVLRPHLDAIVEELRSRPA